MNFANIGIQSLHQRKLIFVMLATLFAQLLLTACATMVGTWKLRNVSSWSVQIKRHKDGFYLVTRNDVAGQFVLKDYTLGNYVQITQAGMFELGVVPVIQDETSEPKEWSACIEEFDQAEFAKKISRMATYLLPMPTVRFVQFVVLPLPPDSEFDSKVTIRLNETLPIQLAFHPPTKQVTCEDWWLHAMDKLIHEFVHSYIEIIGLHPPNTVSEEVMAYSISRCFALVDHTPVQVFPNWDIGNKPFDFEQMYSDILSGNNVQPAWSAKIPTLVGTGITDLQFFRLFGYSFSAEPTQEQLDAVAEYCRYVISKPHDYKKTSYFNRRREKRQ